MHSLSFASITQLRELIAARKISKAELLSYFLARFAQYDKELNTAIELFEPSSIIDSSASTGSLEGIPGLIKDNIAQKGRRLSCASRILENFTSTFDATAIARLKSSGAFLIGRANMDEFAMGSSTETSLYGKTKNPWDHERVPGGSSGGSVAAVAAGLIPWALGSETGGSVRQPAGLCGVVGLKPTYGLISRYGLVAYASSLDQIGIATRSVKDNALVLSAVAGHDLRDSSSLAVLPKDYTHELSHTLPTGLRIGIVKNMVYAPGIDSDVVGCVEQAIKTLEFLGARTSYIEMPSLDLGIAAYLIISRAEAASNLARFDGVRYGRRSDAARTIAALYTNSRTEGFGIEVRHRLLVGNYVLSAGHSGEFYQNAKRVQQLITAEFLKAFESVDVLLLPTQPTPAFPIGAYDHNTLLLDLQDCFTCPINLAGIPALSLPCGMSKDGLPLGFQLVAPHLGEQLLYQVGHAFEQNSEWHTLRPRGY